MLHVHGNEGVGEEGKSANRAVRRIKTNVLQKKKKI